MKSPTLTATPARHHAPGRVRRFRTAVPRLSRFVAEHLLLLPLGAIIAMTWVNLDPESYYPFTYSIANGVAFGFIAYGGLKLLTGQGRSVKPIVWLIAAVFLFRFFYLGSE